MFLLIRVVSLDSSEIFIKQVVGIFTSVRPLTNKIGLQVQLVS